MKKQINERVTRSIMATGGWTCAVGLLLGALGGCQWPPPDMWGQQPEQKPGQYPKNPAFADSNNKQEPTVTIVSDRERSDIVQVINFVPTNPWLIFDPLDGRIDGFKCTIYLGANIDSKVEGKRDGIKGFFGDGTIIVQLFEDVAETGKRSEMKIAHTWELTPEDAYPWRAREMSLLGWGYGLRLQWPAELKLAGRKVAILVSYKRTDGRLISSSKPIVRRVPIRGV